MTKRFFPNHEFAWAFLLLLLAGLAVAAYLDWRRALVPKWLTLGLFACGLLASIVRGAWLGAQGESAWALAPGPLLGGLDGFLFGLVGFLCGFALIFVMWALGTCGGGDVKLFAALGTWLGPLAVLYVLIVSLAVLTVEVVFKFVATGFAFDKFARPTGPSKPVAPPKPGKWRITYSLPVAIATLLVLLWVHRVELGLADPQPSRVSTHAR